MDNRQLAVFVEVAREGSFTRAAERLHLAQSAVSATVSALERELGQRLFDRTTRTVALTNAGHALLPHAVEIHDAFQAARDAVDAVRGGLSGSIRIGYMTNSTLYDLPALLGRFRTEYPSVTMDVAPSATGTSGLAEALRRGELDIAFLAAVPTDYPQLRIDVLARSPLGLAVPVGDPLTRLRKLTLGETSALRFVDLRAGFAIRTLIDTEFGRRGLHRDIDIETSDMTDMAALVSNGLGVAFLPKYLTPGDGRLHWIAIEDADLDMCVSVALARHRTSSAAATRLADMARTTAAARLSGDRPRRPPTSARPAGPRARATRARS